MTRSASLSSHLTAVTNAKDNRNGREEKNLSVNHNAAGEERQETDTRALARQKMARQREADEEDLIAKRLHDEHQSRVARERAAADMDAIATSPRSRARARSTPARARCRASAIPSAAS
jgi:hypothetical protein